MDDWEVAADELGLVVADRTMFANRPKTLRGRIDDIEVDVRYGSSDDTTETRYRVRLPEAIPIRLIRRRWLPWFVRGRDAFGRERTWDRRYVVKGPDAAMTELFLSPDRRASIGDLDEAIGRGWKLTSDTLSLERRGRASRADLEHTIRAMVEFAHRFTRGHV